MEGRGALEPRRTLFLIEGPILYAFKGILVALPQPPPTNKQSQAPPLTQRKHWGLSKRPPQGLWRGPLGVSAVGKPGGGVPKGTVAKDRTFGKL